MFDYPSSLRICNPKVNEVRLFNNKSRFTSDFSCSTAGNTRYFYSFSKFDLNTYVISHF